MAYEMVWDETWKREYPGFYINDAGKEISKTGAATWTLSCPMGNPDRNYRTLRAAKAAAEN